MFGTGFPKDWSTWKKLLWLRFLQGTAAVIQTVTGTVPLTLENALAYAIHSLTQYGLCTQASTPTPDAPVAIKCNNGEIKVKKASGLPFAYDLVDGLTNASSTYVATEILDDVDDFEYEIKVNPSSGSWYILQSRPSPSSANLHGITGSASGSKIALSVGSVLNLVSGTSRATSHVYTVKASHKNGVATIYVKDETTGEEDTKTATYDTSEFVGATTSIGVFGQASNKANSGNTVYYVKLRKSGELVSNLISCTYQDTPGFYDLVSESFIEPTTGSVTAGNLVNDPIEWDTDGTPEVLTVSGPNLANMTAGNISVGYYINNSGQIVASSNNFYYIPFVSVAGGEKYTLSTSESVAYMSIIEYDSAQTFLKRTLFGSQGTPAGAESTITLRSDTAYIRFGSNIDPSLYPTVEDVLAINWMLSQSAEAKPYEPYVAPQTASVVDLLGVGDYKDAHDIISGSIERNVGVILYDGSEDENWSRLGTNAFSVTNSVKKLGKHAMLCSHYVYTAATSANCSSGEFGCSSGTPRIVYYKNELYDTVDDWRAALAADPIIVVYPLATPTTEHVTPQHLHTTAGTNVVDVTANVSPIQLEVEYYQTA